MIANGIAPFLAHEAIKPTKDWRKTLLEALASMDALMSFHSEGFSESEWCGQEVGFALGRDVPVIAVMEAERPAGFLAATQAVRWRRESKEEALEAVYHTLCQAPTTAAALAYAAARKLKFVGSYERCRCRASSTVSATTRAGAMTRRISITIERPSRCQGVLDRRLWSHVR